MINQNLFFSKFNMKPEEGLSRPLYKGPDGQFYYLSESSSALSIFYGEHADKAFTSIISLDKIYPEDRMLIYLDRVFSMYLDQGKSYLESIFTPEIIRRYIFGTLHDEIKPQELYNLCQMYYRSVYVGKEVISLSETCKEVLRIYGMQPDKYVVKELHQLLIEMPDTYYGFVKGIEHGTTNHPARQKRLISYIKSHPACNSVQLIIYNSLLDINEKLDDSYIDEIITLSNSENTFPMYDMPHGNNEVLRTTNDHGWHIFTKIFNNKGYTFRQYRSLCFVDWKNTSFMGSLLYHLTEDEIFAMNIAEIPGNPDEVQGILITYLEQLARKAKAKKLVVHSRPFRIPLLLSKGFEIIEPIEGDSENRSLMIKDLTKTVLIED